MNNTIKEQQKQFSKIIQISLFILLILTILFLSGCATQKINDKVDTVAQEEVKKEFTLPKLTSCDNYEDVKVVDGTFEEIYSAGKTFKLMLKACSKYNEEKKEWIERNFKEKK